MVFNYEDTVKYLLSLGHETLTMKLGLRNTQLLLSSLNHPETAFRVVQIAGTNGKGSTAALLDSICRSAGIKGGLYTSPHLVSFTERVKVSGVEVSREEFAKCATTVRELSEQLVRDREIEAMPTFFEQLTVIALLAFRNAEIELAILETGVGGRLDSTTAANASVAGITQIAMDHEEYLGNRIESIAAEKGAIIRPGVQAVIAKQTPEALAVLLRRCEETGVTPTVDDEQHQIENVSRDGRFCVTFETETDRYEKVWLGLRGRHQIDNAAVSIHLAEALRTEGFDISHDAIVTGLANATHAARLELIPHKPAFLLDGAHNPAGSGSLREYLEQFAQRPLTLVFGAMRDKQIEQSAQILFSVADVLVLTTIENPRSAPVERLQPLASRFVKGRVLETGSSAEALRVAIANTPPDGLICICGSLYLIGELRPMILSLSQEKRT